MKTPERTANLAIGVIEDVVDSERLLRTRQKQAAISTTVTKSKWPSYKVGLKTMIQSGRVDESKVNEINPRRSFEGS